MWNRAMSRSFSTFCVAGFGASPIAMAADEPIDKTRVEKLGVIAVSHPFCFGRMRESDRIMADQILDPLADLRMGVKVSAPTVGRQGVDHKEMGRRGRNREGLG